MGSGLDPDTSRGTISIKKTPPEPSKRGSVRALEWLNFFVADVQTGIGPFLAAYLAASGWAPERLGMLLTVGGLMPIALQIPAGGLVDGARNRRGLLAAAVSLIAGGAVLLGWRATLPVVVTAQVVLACAVVFVAPLLGAIALGIVGPGGFDRQLGRTQAFGAAGNVVTALLMAGVSYWIGMRWIFFCTALLTIPTLACLSRVRAKDIDARMARGAKASTVDDGETRSAGIFRVLLQDRVLVIFFLCAALFHLSNAAMLPELGEMLAHGRARGGGSADVGVRDRDATGDLTDGCRNRKTGEHDGTKAFAADRVRHAGGAGMSLYRCAGERCADRGSGAGWNRKRGVWCGLRAGDRGSHAWNGTVQPGAGSFGVLCGDWRVAEHDLWRVSDSEVQL
jgi:hypothetical protein